MNSINHSRPVDMGIYEASELTGSNDLLAKETKRAEISLGWEQNPLKLL